MPGDFIFIYTDGLPRLLARKYRRRSPAICWPRRPTSITSTPLPAFTTRSSICCLATGDQPSLELSDDLTAVTIRF